MENSKLEKETQEETSVVETEKGPKLTKTLRIILCVVALLLGITAVVLAAVFQKDLKAANLVAVTYVVNIFGSIAIYKYCTEDKNIVTSSTIEYVDSIKKENDKLILEVNNLDSLKNAKIIEVKSLDNDSTVKLFYKLIRE